jgi:hypothetical protein
MYAAKTVLAVKHGLLPRLQRERSPDSAPDAVVVVLGGGLGALPGWSTALGEQRG